MSYRALAAGLTAAAIATLAALLAWDARLAERWAAEDNVIEWVQVLLFLGAFALGARRLITLRAVGRSGAVDMLLAYFFGVLLIGELDLDYRLFGVSVLETRFFMKPHVWLPYKIVAALVIGGAYLAVGVLAFRHRKDLWTEARRLTAEPWGQLVLAGAVIFGTVQLFESQLDRWAPLPEKFLEESLELVAAISFFFGMLERARPPRKPPG